MKLKLNPLIIVLAFVDLMLVGACGKSEPAQKAPGTGQRPPAAAASTPQQQAATVDHNGTADELGGKHAEASESAEAAEHGGGEAVVPAGTAAGIWTQIAQEQTKLQTVMESGQLSDVHHLAFGIRDLVVALAGKAGTLPPTKAASLQSLVERVKTRAANLDEFGDSGNLGGVKREYAALQQDLASLKQLVGGV
jgi:hypothetical protein